MIITQKPDALSLSGNLKNIILDEATGQVAFTLSVGGSEILSGIYTPDESGRIIIDIRRYVEEQLSFNLTYGTEPWQQTMLARTFSFTAGALAAQTFTAIRTGIDNPGETAANWLRANFLTWQPTVKHVTYSTPEFLTYYAASACRLMVKVYYPDGTSSTLNPIALSAGAWTIPVFYAAIAARLGLSTQEELEAEEQLPGAYDVWIADNSGNVLTYIQRYIAGEMRESEQWILFENSLGGLDCFRAYGQGTLEAEHEHQLAELDNMTEEYRTDTTRKQRRSSGWLNRQERRWLLDFFPSRRRWICENGSFRPIVLTEDSVSYSIDNMPAEFEFSFRYATTHSYLNIPRLSEPQTVLNIKAPDLRSFSVPPRLVEFPRLTLLEGALIPVQSPYSDVWSAVSLDDIIQSVTPAAITWDTLPGKPSWIGADKPSYTYGDGYLTGFASASSVQSLLSLINDLFTKESDGAGGYRIKANYGLYTDSFLSAGGLGQGGQGGGGGISTIKFGDKAYTVTAAGDTFITIPMSGTNSITAHLGIDALGVRVTALENRPQGGVTSFNGRTGAITLVADDVPTLQISKITGLQSALDAKQPLIKDTNKLAYSLISGTPTALKNPYALTFGSKTYDGSSAKEITASDLGALTAHQTIYDLIIQKNGTKVGNTYNPAAGAQTINITDVASAATLAELKTWIESLFTKESDGAGGYRIKANFGLYSDSFISAGGIGQGGSTGGGINTIYLGTVPYTVAHEGDTFITLPSYPTSLDWTNIQNKPTTIAGYDITDALSKSVAASTYQPIISDLDDIRTGAGLGATALQPSALNPYRTASAQNDIDAGKVPTTRKVNGHALSADVTVTKGDLELGNVENKSSATIRGELTASNVTTALGATYVQNANYASSAGSVAWANVSGRPTSLSQFTDDVVRGHYLPLSGGTMAGEINLTTNVGGNIPYAGVVNNTSDLTTHLASTKSFIGSIFSNDTWYNVLSIRHRNGLSDGNIYGMYIKSPLTSNGNLIWRQQTGSTTGWGDERTIYDSGNLTKATLGLDNVDNTADANKSVAYATNAGNLGGISSANYYHSGNANKTDVAWSASNLTLNGKITGATSITASGNVSVGGRLTVTGGPFNITGIAQNQRDGIRIHSLSKGTYTGSSIWMNCENESGIDAGMCGIQVDSRYGLSLRCADSASGTTIGTYLTVQYGGNVGIGTNSPSYKLDVRGDIRTNASLRIGSIVLKEENSLLHIVGGMYADGQVSAGGIGSGGSAGGTVTSVSVKINGSVKGTVTTSGTIDLGIGYTKVLNLSSTPTNTTSGEAGMFYTATNDADHMYLCLGQTGQYTYSWLRIKLDGMIA